jgi:hypothetical protein
LSSGTAREEDLKDLFALVLDPTEAEWANFSYIFFRGKFCRMKKMFEKIGIFRGKSFEKSFALEIPKKIQRKGIFHGKKCTKIDP